MRSEPVGVQTFFALLGFVQGLIEQREQAVTPLYCADIRSIGIVIKALAGLYAVFVPLIVVGKQLLRPICVAEVLIEVL